jgi:hypothetical protein
MNPALKTWLEEATLDIAQPDVERITREIGAHYNDELEANLARGLTQEQAERMALEALGHPVVARFKFLKSNLTIAQHEDLQRSLKSESWSNFFVALIGSGLVYFWMNMFDITRLLASFKNLNAFIALPLLLYPLSVFLKIQAKDHDFWKLFFASLVELVFGFVCLAMIVFDFVSVWLFKQKGILNPLLFLFLLFCIFKTYQRWEVLFKARRYIKFTL